MIVARILGDQHAALLTKAIGTSEILVFIWVVSGIKSRWCALFQIVIVITMNIIEFVMVPDLLLFGKFNIIIAFIFVAIIFYNEFVIANNEDNYATKNNRDD
jgi:uncharacterized membrane protein YphA (DoxX/SURF4 family)